MRFCLTKKNPFEYFFNSVITELWAVICTPNTGKGTSLLKCSEDNYITPLAFSLGALPPMIM
jgi:hypothetical protein